jgi:hypothetical protein
MGRRTRRMSRFFVGVAVVAFALVAGLALQVAQDTSAPPHAARPAADVFGSPALIVLGDPEGTANLITIIEVNTYLSAVEAQRIEQERLEEEARQAAVRRAVPRTPTGFGGDCAALAAELGVSESVLWRESRCRWVDSDPSFCNGRGCSGPAQIDNGHWYPVSPWNPNVPGTCYGLSYAECAQRLPRSAW